MGTILRDFGWWFWRLAPGNPILVRVVAAGGRRFQHLIIRGGYLGLLAVLAIAGVVLQQQHSGASLASLAKSASGVFASVSILQLLLVCVIAPVFAASAITQEKDSQTFSILLSTPLSNAQIVLGSLLSRLYFVVVLLVSGVPLFCIMMVYGGVTGGEILRSFALCAATALLMSSWAIALSVMKVGTGRTIFSFYLAIALYLLGGWALAQMPTFIPPEAVAAPGRGDRMSWFAAFHPMLSLWVVLQKTPAPDFASVAHRGFPAAQLLAYPQTSFVALSSLLSLLLLAASLFFVRRGGKLGEPTWFGRLFRRSGTSGSDQTQTRRARHVWSNPVAWREAVTKAAAGSGGLSRLALVVGGLGAGLVLLVAYGRGLSAAETRLWLKGLVSVECGLALFVAMATAATSMTREREGNTIDLLLTTPLQSKQILTGKILGLVMFAAPMLLAPVVTLATFVGFDLVTGRLANSGGLIHPEALASLLVVMLAVAAFSCMVGLSFSLKQTKTLAAILLATVTVGLTFAVPTGCTSFAVSSSAELAAVLAPLSPYSAVMLSVDAPMFLAPVLPPSGAATPFWGSYRVIGLIGAFVSAAAYGLTSWWLHNSLVRNFDMTLRRQSV